MTAMKKINFFTAALVCGFFVSGCAHIKEVPKIMWGSSTKDLEGARWQGAFKTFQGSLSDCFDKVLSIAQEEKMTVFMSDKKKGFIDLMGVAGSLNTTEVGIFLSEPEQGKTKLEVVSTSHQAQFTAAEILFSNFAKTFSEVK